MDFPYLFSLNAQSGGLSTEAFKQALQESVNFPLRPYVLPFLKSHIPVLKSHVQNLAKASNQVSVCAAFLLFWKLWDFNGKSILVCLNSRFYSTFDRMRGAFLNLSMHRPRIHRPTFLCQAKVPKTEANDTNRQTEIQDYFWSVAHLRGWYSCLNRLTSIECYFKFSPISIYLRPNFFLLFNGNRSAPIAPRCFRWFIKLWFLLHAHFVSSPIENVHFS